MRVLAALAVSATLTFGASAQTVHVVETEAGVDAVVATPRGGYIETGRGTFRLDSCTEAASGICLTPDVIRGLPSRAPEGGLPDGRVAESASGDIVRAWFGRPTDRYAHAVLGDGIEGGSLIIKTADGATQEWVLPDNQVFEDITPRIADLNSDGQNEVVTIRASRAGGAAVVVYGLRDGALTEIGASSENGRPNRWLNIAAILPAAVTGHARSGATIVGVRTPHIGGRLFFLTMDGDGRFTERNDIDRNLSNHVIGDRELDLAEAIETPAGIELFIPAQDRRSLRRVLNNQPAIALPGPIDRAIISVDNRLVTATEDGTLLVIEP